MEVMYDSALSICLAFTCTNTDGAIIYSYSMTTRGTVKLLSRGSGEDLGNCCRCITQYCFKITKKLSTARQCSSLASRHLTFGDVIYYVTSQQCSVDLSTGYSKSPCNSQKCVEHWVIAYS